MYRVRKRFNQLVLALVCTIIATLLVVAPAVAEPNSGDDIASIAVNSTGDAIAKITLHPGTNTDQWVETLGRYPQSTLLTADFDGDKSADIASVVLDRSGRGIIRIIASPGTESARTWLPSLKQGPLATIISGDFNGDQIGDLAAIYLELSGQNHRAQLTPGPDGSNQTEWPNPLSSNSASRFVSGDFNGDRIDDIAAISLNIRKQIVIDITLGPDGRRALAPWVLEPGIYTTFISGDFNGDRHADLAGIYLNQNGISFAKVIQGPDGRISPQQWSIGSGIFSEFSTSDFNHDGISDIVAFRGDPSGHHSASFFLGPNGSPELNSWSLPSGITSAFLAADFDGFRFNINGQVSLPGGGTLSGVVVGDGTRTATTDENGNFSIAGVPNGNYTLSASLSGYSISPSNFSNPVIVAGNDLNHLNFLAISTEKYKLVGQVLLPGGEPLGGVTVSDGVRTTTSDGVGRFVIVDVPNGRYALTASILGYSISPSNFSNPIDVNAHDVTGLEFLAISTNSYSISGRITLPGGEGVAGVSVSDGTRSALSNSSGVYTIIDVPDGSYTLSASLNGYSVSPQNFINPIMVRGSDLTNRDFLASSTTRYSISGKIAFSDGGPVGDTQLSDGERSAVSDGNGRYLIGNVPNGRYQLVAIKEGFRFTAAFNNPVRVFGADVIEANFIATCKDGYLRFNNQCVAENSFPATPQSLQASDGTSDEYVQVTWSISENAVTYLLYRSQYPGDRGIIISEQLSETVYRDRSAVPGVRYYYSVRAKNPYGESDFSNTDEGYRFDYSGIADCDGDGVADEQELIDGTGLCDPGSFQLHLKSPAFAKYNTFLDQVNYLELIASGTKAIDAKVTVYAIDGKISAVDAVHLEPGQQIDLGLHDKVAKDSYGIVRIDFSDDEPGQTIQGRVSAYRLEPDGSSYSFAFAKELRNPVHGDTYATSNSFDPLGLGNLTATWAEIMNVDDTPRQFSYKIFNQEGTLVINETFTLPAFGERDLQAGHEIGEGVYLGQIRPLDGATNYFATISRYSSNSPAGTAATSYNYAFPVDARTGNGDRQFAIITNETGGCWTQSNWFELVNIREKQVAGDLIFRDNSGRVLATEHFSFKPYSQFHYNASALLPKGSLGSVELIPDAPGSMLAQSVVYFHDCSENLIQTAYMSQARVPGRDVQAGSYNTFLDIKNMFRIVGTTDEVTELGLELRHNGVSFHEQERLLNGSPVIQMNLSDSSAFGTQENTYGTISVRTNQAGQVLCETLRIREVEQDGKLVADFAFPTMIQ